MFQSKNDVDGALNKYKLIDADSQKGAEIWNNVGLCFFKKKKFIAVCVCVHMVSHYMQNVRNLNGDYGYYCRQYHV